VTCTSQIIAEIALGKMSNMLLAKPCSTKGTLCKVAAVFLAILHVARVALGELHAKVFLAIVSAAFFAFCKSAIEQVFFAIECFARVAAIVCLCSTRLAAHWYIEY